jgi:hypothetical protein
MGTFPLPPLDDSQFHSCEQLRACTAQYVFVAVGAVAVAINIKQ